MSRGLVIGIDSGTSSTRAILFDARGRALAEGRRAYQVLRPRPGWVEQKAEWWWEALVGALRDLLAAEAADPARILGLAITHQRITAVPVDQEVVPLRNAILWNDVRCGEQNQRALKTVGRERLYQRTGYNPGIWTVYKAMWLKDNEPELYREMDKLVLVQDYLVHKLTGELSTTSSAAVMTGCLDVAHRHRWAEDILEELEVRPSIWVDKVLAGGEMAGRVNKAGALATGLPEGLPVITAAGDQPCGVVGAGVTKPSLLGVNGGTSCTMETCAQTLPLDPEANYFIEISPMGTYFPENSIYSGGSALMNWLKAALGGEEEAGEDWDWEAFYSLAGQTPPGNLGLMMVPYLSGATAPYWDVDARGVLFGLSMDHSRPHLVRAVIEGLAYEVRRQTAFMEKGTGVGIEEVRMYGGSARSRLWNQVFADVLGVQVRSTRTVETTALGAAICAAAGAGLHPDIETAAERMVQVEDEFSPDRANQNLYDRLFKEVYGQFYDRIHDLVHQATTLAKDTAEPAAASKEN